MSAVDQAEQLGELARIVREMGEILQGMGATLERVGTRLEEIAPPRPARARHLHLVRDE